MDHNCRKGVAALIVLGSVMVASGCSKKPQPQVVPPPVSTQTEAPKTEPTPPPPAPAPTPQVAEVNLQDAFFDFDKYTVRDDARAALNSDGKMLVDSKDTRVMVEGHCDERGTVEYNLALGQKRADAAKGYLVQYGVDASRLSTISYGKERPFAQGHDETAWSQNRRAHMIKQ